MSAYIVKVRQTGARSEWYDYYVVRDAGGMDEACDKVIVQTGYSRKQMTAAPVSDVYKIGKSNRRGIYYPA